MSLQPLSDTQRRALSDAARGPLVRTTDGWNTVAGRFVPLVVAAKLRKRGLVAIAADRKSAEITERGRGELSALAEGKATNGRCREAARDRALAAELRKQAWMETLQWHDVNDAQDSRPDADVTVLICIVGDEGAEVWPGWWTDEHDAAGEWYESMGAAVKGVVAWAEMPKGPAVALKEPPR